MLQLSIFLNEKNDVLQSFRILLNQSITSQTKAPELVISFNCLKEAGPRALQRLTPTQVHILEVVGIHNSSRQYLDCLIRKVTIDK